MKQQLQAFPGIVARDFARENVSVHPVTARGDEAAPAETVGRWPQGMRLVGILAFGQSLLFLALWLWLCASVGAATKAEPWKEPKLEMSDYRPTKTRDPFLPKALSPTATGETPAVVDVSLLKLQGIVYEPVNPSAMVNDKLLYAGRPVTVSTERGTAEIVATEITREHVLVKVGGRQVELRLGLPPVEKGGNP